MRWYRRRLRVKKDAGLTLYRLDGIIFPMALHTRSDSLATRELILAAAVKLATHSGPSALTIDGVAKVAEMSKGGVLYHFPSKDALFLELVRFGLREHWTEMRSYWKQDQERKGRWHRSWIRASFNAIRRDKGLQVPALVAMVLTDSRLQELLCRFSRRIRRCLALDGLDPLWSRVLQNSVMAIRMDTMFDTMFDPSSGQAEMLEALEQRSLVFLQGMIDNTLVFEAKG